MRELPASYAVALRLRDRGTPDLEIAEVVGIAPASLETHLRIAEAKLARILEDATEGGTA